jgi:hypothetical protein
VPVLAILAQQPIIQAAMAFRYGERQEFVYQ